MKWQHGVSGVVNGAEIDTHSHVEACEEEVSRNWIEEMGREERLEGGFTSRDGSALRGYIRFSPCQATRNSIFPLKTDEEEKSFPLMD